MKCEETKGYINEYIKHALSERKQEEFIKHIKVCPECFQELETYFIVDVAMQYFDGDKEDNYDIQGLLQNDLDKRVKKRQREKLMMVLLIMMLVIFISLMAGLLLWII